MNEKWFAMSLEEIEKKLKTNAALGLSPKAARSRCQEEKKPFFTIKRKRWDRLLLALLSDFFLMLLVLVAFFSLFFEGDYLIGSAMLILIAVNLGLSYFLLYRDKRSVESMAAFFTPNARVVRGGRLYIVDYKDVVEGDVILVEKGDILGCDARLVYSDNLSVNMKLDKKTDKLMQKFAGGAVNENELNAENMSNMLHAGSVIRTGSGRAIVVATGEFTYLGAITGGITEIASEELPYGLAALKQKYRGVGLLLLLLILPFCMFSLMFGHFTGGNVLLSETLAVILSIGATAMLSRFSNLFLCFFVRHMRRSALAEDPCIIRSLGAFDKIADADYLFMLDGSIATDGILHFSTLFTTDGESRELENVSQNAAILTELVGLYTLARRGTLSISGVSSQNTLDIGIDEFLKKSRIDTEALRIRCKLQAFLPGVDKELGDILSYVDGEEKRELCVSLGIDALNRCDYALFSGVKKELTYEGKDFIKRNFIKYTAEGNRPIIFSLKNEAKVCFVGMLVLGEGTDDSLEPTLSLLKKNGVKIISFTNCVGRENVPEIPAILRSEKRAYAAEFIKKGNGISQDFGAYDEYCGFDEAMIAELARFVKSQNKTLAVIGFSGYAAGAVELADVFISCAPVMAEHKDSFDGEIQSMEIPGEQSSASCTQEVKAEADILLMRPVNGKGGLGPLAKAMEYCGIAYKNLKSFMIYMLTVQLMRIATIAFPMLFGYSTADARQMLFLGFVLDLFVMMIFVTDMRRATEDRRKIKQELAKNSVIDMLKINKRLTLCAVVGSVSTLLLPEIFDMIGIFGSYLYRAEFTYVSLLLMQILTLFAVYSRDIKNVSAHKRLINNIWAQIGGGVILLFTLLCFIITPFGRLFGVIESPIFYFLISLVPPIAFGLCFVVMGNAEKHKGGVKKQRKM